MTNYVNEENKGGYGKAVKATLAATLAVGMVPAGVAFADTQEETVEGSEVDLLVATQQENFQLGKITAATDNNGQAIDLTKAISFTANGAAHYVVPTQYTYGDGMTVVDLPDNLYYLPTYYAYNAEKGWKEGEALDKDTLTQPGTYCVTLKALPHVTGDATWESEVLAVFTIGSANLNDATLFQVNDADPKDVSDVDFEFAGEAIDFGVALNGAPLTEGVDYTIDFYQKGTHLESTPKWVGDFTAVIKGAGIYAGQEKVVDFSIAMLDLSKAEIVLDEDSFSKDAQVALGTPVKVISVNGRTDISVIATITAVPDTYYNQDGRGVYTVTVTSGDSTNVTGEQTIEVIRATDENAKVLYNGKEIAANYMTDYSNLEKYPVFDVDMLGAYTGNNGIIKDADLDIVVRDADGNVIENADLTKPGFYQVAVSIDSASCDYKYKSEVYNFTLTVKQGDVKDADMFVLYDGKAIQDADMVYTGEDYYKNVSVVVKSGDKTLVAGEDYEVTLEKQVAGEWTAVKEIVDHGTYRVTITSDSYAVDAANNSVTFEVAPAVAHAADIRINPETLIYDERPGQDDAYQYTGKVIVPELQFKNHEGEYAELPADTYELSYEKFNDATGLWEPAAEIKDEGRYSIRIDDVDANDNYVVEFAMIKVNVGEKKIYTDVVSSDWFYDYVYKAEQAGYMHGIGGSDIFAPYETTTRAMAVQVLARMANVNVTVGSEGTAENPFTDVQGAAWYGPAIGWASATGIVQGYVQADGTSVFMPDQDVTRSEFCVMMQRYAAKTGQGVALEAGEADTILAKYADGAAVEDWAKEAVAWAVKNEIFGNDTLLRPSDDIARAEMAKMSVAFQPEALDHHTPLA